MNEKITDWHLVFIFSSLGFIFGLALGDGWKFSGAFFLWIFCLELVLFLIWKIYFSQHQKIIYFGVIIGLGLLGGLGRAFFQTDHQTDLINLVDKKVLLSAKVVREPDEREKLTRLVVKPENYQTKILLTVERYPVYQIGDEILVTGKLARPANFFTAEGTNFDYRAYLAKDNIFYEMYQPEIILQARPESGFLVLLARLKTKLLTTINNILPEPESSLLAGILLGAKKGVGEKIINNFRLAGLSHILVLSGFNLTFVALFLLKICSFLPKLFGGVVGFISIIIFGLLAGGGSVVWRAVLMSLLAFYAKLTGRIFDVTVGIIFSMVALVAYNPATLLNDLGFQLSIMALVGIIYLAPILQEKIFYRLTKWSTLADLVSSTFGAQLAVLPLLWYATGQISLVGFISNLIVLPIIPVVMGLGALTVFLGFWSYFLAWPISFITYLLLKIILILADLFARVPFAESVFSLNSWWPVLFLYSLIFLPAFWYWKNSNLN